MNPLKAILILSITLPMAGCARLSMQRTIHLADSPFKQDFEFLKQHTQSFLLKSGDSMVAVAPDYQARVMTSTFGGENAPSFGWINRPTIEEGILKGEQAAGKLQQHIHVFGGEERFWLGPEGGQFGLYFPPGSPFEFEFWRTPAFIDTETYALKSLTWKQAVFLSEFDLQNHSGFGFQGTVKRTIRILDRDEIEKNLGVSLSKSTRVVAFETENVLTNTGRETWTKDTGALSIWLLGMYPPSQSATVVIPYQMGSTNHLGPIVNDSYFGIVPEDRLVVSDGFLFFKADGQFRSKIGVPPGRSLGKAASLDSKSGVLNLVTYELPNPIDQPYVNSMWEIQANPFEGDAINAYNDGPPQPGTAPLGPFYELETSSPAAFLSPGQSITHTQRTYHIQDDEASLDDWVRSILGIGIQRIKDAF